MSDIDEKQYHALLPKLKEGSESKVGAFNSAGVWDNRQASELSNLSESLDVAQIDPKYFDIDSIPDMWARPLLFEMALYDPSHPLHERVLGEWRGLLALLALKDLRGLGEVQFVSVDIPRLEKERDEREKETREPKPRDRNVQPEEAGPDFLSALAKLAPEATLSKDTSWHHLYVIVFNRKPIGLTSPTTLLCTAADCLGRVGPTVKWFGTRFLQDPTSDLNQMEKEALAGWLEKVRIGLQNDDHVDHAGKLWNTLSRLLEQFVDDLRVEPNRDIELTESGWRMEGVFTHLDRFITSTGGDPTTSEVGLVPSEGKEPPLTLLVIDDSIATQWRKEKQNVTILGTKTLASVPLGGPSGPRNILLGVPLQSDKYAAEWRTPKDFFTDTLFVVGKADAFLNTIRIKGDDRIICQRRQVTPILPLKEEILSYLSARDIANRVSFETSDDQVEVRFKLPLLGFHGEKKDFEISRLYKFRDGEVQVIPNLPFVETWPDFTAPNWRAYYTYFSISAIEDTFYARPYSHSGAAQAERESSVETYQRDTRTEREITRATVPAEALVCTAWVAKEDSSEMREVPAGLVPLERPGAVKAPKGAAGRWRIGVDFGTTNTNVYAREGEAEPIRLDLTPSLRQITTVVEERAHEMETGGFLPVEQSESPFLSFFHPLRQVNDNRAVEPLLHGHIFFLQDVESFNAKNLGIKFDLKWGDARDRLLAKAFLEQLCLQCSAEVVRRGAKEIRWGFSFPTAFSPNDREAFRQIWEDVCSRTKATTGLDVDLDLRAESEGIASARFFIAPPEGIRGEAATVNRGAVCVDIGGGTSDVSVWQGGHNLKFQTSLRFAGRDILVHLLQRKPAFLQNFDVATTHAESLRGDPSFYAQADAIIRYKGSQFLNKLQIIGATDDVKHFIQLVALGLAGLVHYLGLTLKYLHREGRYKPEMPDVYFGGNGARLFHLLAGGSYDERRSRVTNLFRKLLLHTTGFKDTPFKIHVSPVPKAEVAYGLVRTETALTYDADAYKGEFISGEDFTEDGNDLTWDHKLSEDLFKKKLRIAPSLSQLRDLLDIFNSCAEDAGLPPPPTGSRLILDCAEDVAEKVNARLEAASSKDVSMIRLEPLFITALKVFLEIKADEWQKR